MRQSVFGMILALSICGCGEGGQVQVLTFSQLPEGMMATAKQKLPDVTFEKAVKRKSGIIEINGRNFKGKYHSIEFSPAGEVVKVE